MGRGQHAGFISSLNPAEAFIFMSKMCLIRLKINEKEAGVRPFFIK